MIEVEKKFALGPGQEEKLIKGAAFVKEKTFTDIYYDTADYRLTSKDWWFRDRDRKFELKIALAPARTRIADQYREIVNDLEIVKEIGLKSGTILNQENLESQGLKPVIILTTKRRTYACKNFTIDIDTASADGFIYSLAEIELMVNSQSEVPLAVEQIINFAKTQGLSVGHTPGKIQQYLFEKKRNHWQVLMDAGVIRVDK